MTLKIGHNKNEFFDDGINANDGQFAEANHATAQVITVNAQNEIAPLYGFTEGESNGVTTEEIGGSITDVADGPSGKVTMTSAAHGLANGDEIQVTGTTDYDGRLEVSNITTNTFDVPETFNITRTGTWKKGRKLVSSKKGKYLCIANISATCAASKEVELSFSNNGTIETKSTQAHMFSGANKENIAISAVLDLEELDEVGVELKNVTDDTNVTITHSNFTISRIN